MKAGCCISEPAQISGTFEFIRECLLMIQPLAAIVTSTDVTCIVSFCVHNLINYNKVTRSHVQPVFIEGLPLASREQNRHKSRNSWSLHESERNKPTKIEIRRAGHDGARENTRAGNCSMEDSRLERQCQSLNEVRE